MRYLKISRVFSLQSLAVFLGYYLLVQTSASTQEPSRLETGAVMAMPTLTFSVKDSDAKRFHKYFISHKPNVSFEKARADIDECLRYSMGANEAGIQLFPPIPDFVPLSETQSHQDALPEAHNGDYGLVGDVMAAMIVPGVNQALAQANVRRCMGYKDYDRYGVSREEWESLDGAEYSVKLRWLANIASGPTPTATQVSK